MKYKRSYMIGERPSIVGACEVTAKPASKLRRVVYDILPYWQGSLPKFKIIFEALSDIKYGYSYLCAIQYSNGERSKPQWEIKIHGMNKGNMQEYIVNEMHLVYTGDTFIIVAEKTLAKEVKPHYESVYLFNVTNRSWLALALLAGIIAGMVSAIGTWIIS